jgi:hypothetical protein
VAVGVNKDQHEGVAFVATSLMLPTLGLTFLV